MSGLEHTNNNISIKTDVLRHGMVPLIKRLLDHKYSSPVLLHGGVFFCFVFLFYESITFTRSQV